MSRVTGTLGVPPRQTTLAGTCCPAAAARVLTPSTTQSVPLGGGGLIRGAGVEEMIPRGSTAGSPALWYAAATAAAGGAWGRGGVQPAIRLGAAAAPPARASPA